MPENMYVTESADFKNLCEKGFTEEEAASIIVLKERLELQKSQKMQEEQHRLNFMRWLVEHDRIRE